MPTKRARRRLPASSKSNASMGFTNRPSYLGIKDYVVTVPGLDAIASTAVTTGVCTVADTVSASVVTNFTRFSNLFDEVRTLRVSYEIIPLGIYTGVAAFFFSELNLGTPTPSEAQQRTALYLKLNEQSKKNATVHWKNSDYTDSSFSPTSSPGTVCYFYAYTDGANFGAPVTVVQLFMCRPTVVLQFRGLKSN